MEKQSADFSKATMKARTLCNDVFNLPKEKPRSSGHGKYPSRIKVKYRHFGTRKNAKSQEHSPPADQHLKRKGK